MPIPTPSMTARRIAQPMAPFRIALGPPLTASEPPVKKPAMIAFQGSSLCLTPLTAQSNVENRPPHTPKFPPRTGALALIAVRAARGQSESIAAVAGFNIPPILLSPYGLFLKPLIPCQIEPPMAWIDVSHPYLMLLLLFVPAPTPMQKAPPKSLSATQGQGSLV